ncbi:hypothetical protein ABZZ20_34200 [Streptomyces sp. NPDC006430]|uniref:hypothetical protein n=1 Tax=Streptomyces sp. NPDC006430 TaxID=3154299 RepID=UPI0033AEB74E
MAQEFVGVVAGLGAQVCGVGLCAGADAVGFRVGVLADGFGFPGGVVEGLPHGGADPFACRLGLALEQLHHLPATAPDLRQFGIGLEGGRGGRIQVSGSGEDPDELEQGLPRGEPLAGQHLVETGLGQPGPHRGSGDRRVRRCAMVDVKPVQVVRELPQCVLERGDGGRVVWFDPGILWCHRITPLSGKQR